MKEMNSNFISFLYLIIFVSLFLIISTKKEIEKSIFDETYIKNLIVFFVAQLENYI